MKFDTFEGQGPRAEWRQRAWSTIAVSAANIE